MTKGPDQPTIEASMTLIAILGSHPDLSLAELSAVLNQPPEAASQTVAIFDSEIKNMPALQNLLGGTQKLGIVLGAAQTVAEATALMQRALESLPGSTKLRFGISVHALDNPSLAKTLATSHQKIGLALKKSLKSTGRSVRYVTSAEPTLSTVVVTKNKLTSDGREFLLIATERGILVGQTKTVQDFESWSHRDFDRPGRNAKRGMLPPKLARMMINISGIAPKGATLLDPFCGSGTILAEGAVLGFAHLIGSDISPEAVFDTREHLTWLAGEGVHLPDIDLFALKAEQADAKIPSQSVDLIATEPFLGRPRQGTESVSDVRALVADLTDLYTKSFITLAGLLKPTGRMVIAFPVHFVGTQAVELPVSEILSRAGLLPDATQRTPLLYKRSNQFVGRHIVRCRLDRPSLAR